MKIQDGDTWIDDETYYPCSLVDCESTRGKNYEIDVDADLQDEYEDLIEHLESKEIGITGYSWMVLFLTWIQEKEPILYEEIENDTEASTCVLYVGSEASQFKVAGYILQLLKSKKEFKRIVKKAQSNPENEWAFE